MRRFLFLAVLVAIPGLLPAADWTGFRIPDEFVVGYGIDFAQRNRNLPYIGKVRFLDAD